MVAWQVTKSVNLVAISVKYGEKARREGNRAWTPSVSGRLLPDAQEKFANDVAAVGEKAMNRSRTVGKRMQSGLSVALQHLFQLGHILLFPGLYLPFDYG